MSEPTPAAAPGPAPHTPAEYDLAVIGGGPAGAAAALRGVRAGYSVVVVEAGAPGRDKTCGDGLTPRAIAQLKELDLFERFEIISGGYTNDGLKLHGFGGDVTAPWPQSAYGTIGSAVPRTTFDAWLLSEAQTAGAHLMMQQTASDPTISGGTLTEFSASDQRIRARWIIVADGARSTFGKALGRTWHKEQVYGIAARAYADSPRSAEPWMHSHVELRGSDGAIQPGYGWIFPLGNGAVNIGLGALSTSAKPAKINTKKLLRSYADANREDWDLTELRTTASAVLPMGGSVSGVAGRNWMLIGDAAAGINPLNGEGIDYAMEMAALAVALIEASGTDAAGFTNAWPQVLRDTYGEAFTLARSAARLLTHPRFLPAVGPVGLRGPIGSKLMPAAARLMANLVTEEDKDILARAWHMAGRRSLRTATRREQPLWG